ncbi:MAG: ATPase [Gammaproteobacteria bacterium]|nr:MAG: ATPase [Gammaproteobacteria bacterium]
MKKAITLMGMSGVGKTTLSRKLPQDKWFHYSGDYRIASHYLSDVIGDFLKTEAMKSPLIADLLKSDSIFIGSNLTIDNLAPLSTYIGKLGRTDLGGLDLDTFLTRQRQHRKAEVSACYDIGYFKSRAKKLYGYDYFLHDAGGSICELDDQDVIAYMARETDFVYIHADSDLIEAITERALIYPKPLYYNEAFLHKQLDAFLSDSGIDDVNHIVPDDFIRFVVPKLMQHRRSRYLAIAERYGKIIDAREAFHVRDEADFFELLETA